MDKRSTNITTFFEKEVKKDKNKEIAKTMKSVEEIKKVTEKLNTPPKQYNTITRI